MRAEYGKCGVVLAALLIALACCAIGLAAAEPVKVTSNVVELVGTTAKNGWTCYGGSFWPNAMARSPREEAVWMGSPVGLIRYDLKTGELRRWSTLDGLADNTVYDLEFDAEGNVWAATMSGVSKFDGKEFTGWDRKAIGHNAFGAIAVDIEGRPWAGCTGRYALGAFCRMSEGQWIQYSGWALHDNGGFPNAISDIQADSRGGVWLCGVCAGIQPLEGSWEYWPPWGGSLYYIGPEGTAEAVKLPAALKWPQFLLMDKNKDLYVLFNDGAGGSLAKTNALCRLVLKNRHSYQGKQIPDLSQIEWQEASVTAGVTGMIHAVHCDENGDIWLATSGGIGKMTANSYSVSIPFPDSNLSWNYSSYTFKFITLKGGQEALCFYARSKPEGFYHWKNGVWNHIAAKLDGPARPGRGFPIIGNTGRGPDGKMYFVRYDTTVFDGKEWATLNRTTSFIRNKDDRVEGLLWTDAAAKKEMVWLKGSSGPVPRETVFNNPKFAPEFVDSRKHYWQIGAEVLEFDGQAVIDHTKDKDAAYLLRPFGGYYNLRCGGVGEDAKGRIWLATQWGLLRKDGSAWEIVGSKFKGMLGMSNWRWACNGKDTISFGGPWGASDYNTVTKQWRNSIRKGLDFPGTAAEFPGSMVEHVAADTQGRMWYGFYEAGVACRELDGTLTVYTTKDGLANGSVWGIWADDDGTMWFNTFGGTSHFDPTKFVQTVNP